MSKICTTCGCQCEDDAVFCPSCGNKFPLTQPLQPSFDDYNMQADVAANKNLAAIGYLGMILLTLVAAPNSRFIRFHANQALLLGLFTLLSVIPLVGWIWGIFCFVCLIMGIVNAINGQFKELPVIGKFRIIN